MEHHHHLCQLFPLQMKIRIRLWGRRQIHLLERLIPLADHFDLYVKGADSICRCTNGTNAVHTRTFQLDNEQFSLPLGLT